MRLSRFAKEIKELKSSILMCVVYDPEVQKIIKKYAVENHKMILIVSNLYNYFIEIVEANDNAAARFTSVDFAKNLKKKDFSIEDFISLYSSIKKAISKEILNNTAICNFLTKKSDSVKATKDILDELHNIFDINFADNVKAYYGALSSLLSQYKKVINTSSIVSKTDTKGIITYVNDKFCRISGYERAELLGKPHNMVRHSDMPQAVFKDLWSTIKKGDIWRGIVQNRAKNAESYFVDSTVIPILNQNQEIIEYISIRHDITEQIQHKKAIENQLKIITRQKHEIIFQNRAAAMGEMIENIAHQWRQPLQIIAMTIIDARFDLEESKSIDMQKGTMILEAIDSQVEYLSRTIDDFMNFLNPNKAKKAFCLNEVILYSVRLVEPSMKKLGISITIKHIHKKGCSPNHDCLWEKEFLGYKSELSQVLLNLFSNAKDTLLENKIKKPCIVISCVPNGDLACINVSDNGGGIPEKVLPKVFDPYFTTKHKKQGTGVGLYMSRIIVEEHHQGTLSVVNDSLGAVFSINLPIKKEAV
ncbi:MAG: hypothetical protein C0627_00665 [Sulfurimonas sp.]|nr:MAG: hypothetical protein C0627_00665 [Sulfurimonas sp.]